MRYALMAIGANTVAIISVSFAGYMAVNDKSGWGWFLVIGILACCTVKTNKE